MKKRSIKVTSVAVIASMMLSSGSAFAMSGNDGYRAYDIDYVGGNFSAVETQNGTTLAGSTCVDRALKFINVFMPDFKLPEVSVPEIPELPERPEQPENPDMPGNPGNDGPSDGAANGDTGSISRYAKEVVNIVNSERSKAGLAPLTLNSALSKVAQTKSEDMRDNNYFSHTSPTYGTPFEMITEFGISYKTAGENIAKGQRTPESVMNAWMNSQGHRENIMNTSYVEIGIGYCTDSSGNTYWVQMFTGK